MKGGRPGATFHSAKGKEQWNTDGEGWKQGLIIKGRRRDQSKGQLSENEDTGRILRSGR